MHLTSRLLALLMVSVLAACGGRDEETLAPDGAPPVPASLVIAELQMARTVDDGSGPSSEATTVFAPDDAIDAVILAEGNGDALVSARWRYGGEGAVFHEESHHLSGSGVHAFRVVKGDGFPAGDYQVEILLDGEVAVSRRFEVREDEASGG